MKNGIIIICLLFCYFYGEGQKLFLKRNLKRSVVKTETFIGITVKGETYHYENWKNICLGCNDSIAYKNIWLVDSLQKEYMVVKQYYESDTAYIFDTINYYQTEKRELYYKEWFLVEYFDSPDGNYLNDKLVFKFPKYILRKKIAWKNIESLNFSKAQVCSELSFTIPLQALITTVGGPFIATDQGKFHWDIFIFSEIIGISKIFTIHRYLSSLKVKKYELKEWKIKVKK